MEQNGQGLRRRPWSPSIARVPRRSGRRDPEAERRKTFANNIDRKYMSIEDNYVTDDDPGFVDMAHMDRQLRDDSVVYHEIPDFRPIPLHPIGLYQHELRATWPSSPDLP